MTEADVKPVPSIRWASPQITETLRQVTFWCQGWLSGTRVELHAGDGKYAARSGSGTFTHTYDHPGIYTLTARRTGNGAIIDAETIVIRESLQPQVTVEPGPDPEDWTQRLITFPADVPWATLWRFTVDDGEPVEYWATPGGQYSTFLAPGQHELHVEDVHARITGTVPFEVRSPYDPEFNLRGSGGAPYMIVDATLDRVDRAKAATIDWGDGSSTAVPHPTEGHTETHEYAAEGAHWVSVAYDDGSGNPHRQPYWVPWGP